MMFSKPSRNHITIILEQIGAVGLVLLTGSFSMLFEIIGEFGRGMSFSSLLRRIAVGETHLIVILVVVLSGIILSAWLFFRWRKTFFYIQGEYLVVEKNTLMRRSSRLPLGSIATVNLERNLFERIVGTAKVKLDINSAATANRTDFTFVLSLEKAQAFEKELVKIKKENVSEQPEQARQSVSSFTVAKVLRDVVLGQPLAQIVLLVITASSAVLSDFSLGYGTDISRMLPTAFILLSWLASMVMQFMSAYGFKMEKDEKSFYISSGLMKKRQYSFDRDKVNALFIRRPLFARAFGLYRAEVAVIGLGNDKHETPRICLLVKKAELDSILAECAPDFVCTSNSERSCKAGLAASMCFYLILGAVAATAVISVNPLISAAILALSVVLGFLSYRSKTLAADENVFSYSCGIFSRNYGYFKYSSIQTAQLCTNTLMR
ncbi:MAG: PH domain-containing protein, partial [Clostridia bacterium]|nr:PH domain-containing protein [Clostridia bacterium]